MTRAHLPIGRRFHEHRGVPSFPRPATLSRRTAPRTAHGRAAFLAVLSDSPVPAVLVDLGHGAVTVLAANVAARSSLSPAGPLVGGDLGAVLHPDDREALVDALAGVVGGHLDDWTHETDRPQPFLTARLTLSRLSTPGESPLAVLQLHELSDRREVEALVARAQEAERQAGHRRAALERAKHDFLTTMGHEMRTPLASILGFTEMLQDTAPDEPAAADLLARVRRNGERMLELVEGMAMLTRIGSTPPGSDTPDVDLRDVVRRAVDRIACAVGARGLRLEVDLPESPVALAAHDADLTRAVTELLDNAVKFTPEGGTITVSLARTTSECTLVVEDTGHGIPADEQARVFEPFARTSRTIDEAVPGAGIGLSILREVVTAHGGTVTMTSGPRGTRFLVRLPLRQP